MSETEVIKFLHRLRFSSQSFALSQEKLQIFKLLLPHPGTLSEIVFCEGKYHDIGLKFLTNNFSIQWQTLKINWQMRRSRQHRQKEVESTDHKKQDH